MDAEEARAIGYAIWRVRDERRKGLRLVAELAGMSKDTLNRIERGLLSPTLAQIHALAEVLEVSPQDLTRLPVPAPANGHTDSTMTAVDLALMAVSHDLPDGQVLPAEVLRSRVKATVNALCRCEQERQIGPVLPGLIRDLHTSIAAGRDVAELLGLAVWLHTQATVPWLRLTGASLDLCGQAVMLARQAAQERDTAAPMGLVAAAGSRVMLAKGALDLARARLDAVTVPTDTTETMQVAGLLVLRHSLVASVDGRPGDADAALQYAAELAARTGEANVYGLGFGPSGVGMWRLWDSVELGDDGRAVTIAEGMNPQLHPNRSSQAGYWIDYGRALARLRGRHNDAVRALRRAETISPHSVQRSPIVRDVIAVLVQGSRRGSAADEELRGMARRAGLLT